MKSTKIIGAIFILILLTGTALAADNKYRIGTAFKFNDGTIGIVTGYDSSSQLYQITTLDGIYYTQKQTVESWTSLTESFFDRFKKKWKLALASITMVQGGVCSTYGDVNCDGVVTIVDANYVAQYTVGDAQINDFRQRLAADVNGDGAITIVDATFIAQYTVGSLQDPTAKSRIGQPLASISTPAPTPTSTPSQIAPITTPTAYQIGDCITINGQYKGKIINIKNYGAIIEYGGGQVGSDYSGLQKVVCLPAPTPSPTPTPNPIAEFRISTVPSSTEIYIDGTWRANFPDNVPYIMFALPTGKHVIKATKPGYQDKVFEVVIVSGTINYALGMTLSPISTPTPTPVATQAPATTPAPTSSATPVATLTPTSTPITTPVTTSTPTSTPTPTYTSIPTTPTPSATPTPTPTPAATIKLVDVTWDLHPDSMSYGTANLQIIGTWSGNVKAQIKKNVLILGDPVLGETSIYISGTNNIVTVPVKWYSGATTGDYVYMEIEGIYQESDPTIRRASGTEVPIPPTGISTDQKGNLEVLSNIPQAKLYVNGMLKGEGNSWQMQLNPGKYDVEVKKEGYISYSTQTEITAGGIKTIEATLSSAMMTSVTATSTPSPAGTTTQGTTSTQPSYQTTPKPIATTPSLPQATSIPEPEGSDRIVVFGVVVVALIVLLVWNSKRKTGGNIVRTRKTSKK